MKKIIHDLTGIANTNISVSWNQQREDSLLQTYGVNIDGTESTGHIGITKLRQWLADWEDPLKFIETDD